MENNGQDSGSRVTRSLRKRLTSVDSDNSSRPGTPNTTKLTPISEISASPSKSARITRRNSISALAISVKTPVKRGAGSSAVIETLAPITPARRSTRRRSVSVYENEDTPQTLLKIPFAPLAEKVEQSDLKAAKVTRSQSKSPQPTQILKTSPSPKSIKRGEKNENKKVKIQNKETDFLKKRKPGPKCKTREHEESQDLSDIEVSVLENEIEDMQNKITSATIIVNDDDSNQVVCTNMEENEICPNYKVANISKTDIEFFDANNFPEKNTFTLKKNELEFNKNINESNNSYYGEQNDNLQSGTTTNAEVLQKLINEEVHREKSKEPTTSDQSNKIENVEKQTLNISTGNNLGIEKQVNCEKITLEENKTNSSLTELVEFSTPSQLALKDCSITEGKEKSFLSEKVEIISVNTLTLGDKTLPKKVEFVSSPSNDMVIKNVYPKTPVLTKIQNSSRQRTSYTHDESFKGDGKSLAILLDNPQNSISITDGNKIELNNKEELQIIETNVTPLRGLKCGNTLEIVQSSTPIDIESSKRKGLLSIVERNNNEVEGEFIIKDPLIKLEKSLNEKAKETAESKYATSKASDNDIQSKEELKWINPCVKGTTANGSKLDVIITQNNTNFEDFCENTEYVVSDSQKSAKKSISHPSADEQNVEDIYNEFVEVEDEEEEEESYKRNHNFHDDEAIEIDDYKSGDSMDSEEEEESYKRNHSFHDDEALEIDGYESGDSMDSEERRNIDENEIPVDGESIGSHTTQDEYVDEEDSEKNDSFIVSDTEEPESTKNNITVEKLDGNIVEYTFQKNKTYKRLQRLDKSSSSSSSSSDEDVEVEQELNNKSHNDHNDDNNTNVESGVCISESNKLLSKSSEDMILDTSKLSASALQLQCSIDSESEENNTEITNNTRKEILRNLNQSAPFNKSVREMIQDDNNEMSLGEEHTISSSDGSGNEKHKINYQSHLGEVSVTSESDADKENEHKSPYISHKRKNESGLSNSFNNKNQNPEQKKEREEGLFTMDVTANDKDIENAVSDVKLEDPMSTSLSPIAVEQNKEFRSKDIGYMENNRQIPLSLGKPLIRTRRQSLALPTNPDMEICSSSYEGGENCKTTNRKSVEILPTIDFNPSQSLIDNTELHKSEQQRLVAKRKRLSKSFCGTSETHDNSIVDIDVRHLQKKSKLMCESSIIESHHDSIENSSKIFTKIISTPHEKINKTHDIQHILKRCTEIVEAGNRAKFEAKTNKNKSKHSKKKSISTSNKTNTDDMPLEVSKEIKRKDKTKIAIAQAIKAADVILSKKKKTPSNTDKQSEKRLAPTVLKAIGNPCPIGKPWKKDNIYKQEKNVHTSSTSTSAGNFMELPQTPEMKRKKVRYIQLPTGKVSVEPITPKTRLVQALNGVEFRETPITPNAVGFKVQQIAPAEKNIPPPPPTLLKNKQKRNHDGSFKHSNFRKSQWTQSGLFIEEKIAKNSQITRSEGAQCRELQKTKQRLLEKDVQHNIYHTFKESALMRPDIKRSSKRELLLLKERRQIRGHY